MSIEFIEYKGKKILYEDYSDSTTILFLELIDEAENIIKNEPENSILALVNVTNSKFNNQVSNRMNTFVKSNTPYIKYSAIFGISGLQKVIYRAIVSITGRKNLKVCNNKQEALEFLTSL